MEPLDFTERPPRGPRERLDGLLMLARTIDKFRASLPGGRLNGYRIAGMSGRLLGWLGVDEESMRQQVAAAATDDDVARWLRERTDASQYAAFNERMENRSLADVEDKTHAYELYPWLRESDIVKLFDIMEEDDRRTFQPSR
jgi:hypothetical protein